MKQKLFKYLKGVAFVLVAFLMVVAIGEATGYVKTLSRTTSPIGWSFLSGSHTFVAANDTAYFMFTPAQPKFSVSTAYDTLTATIQVQSRPLFTAAADGSVDTSNVAYEVWATSDTSGWWGGATRSKSYRGLWSVQSFGQDSATSGVTARTINLGRAILGVQPYMMVVAIGKTPSGGKGQNIGNIVRVNINHR